MTNFKIKNDKQTFVIITKFKTNITSTNINKNLEDILKR